MKNDETKKAVRLVVIFIICTIIGLIGGMTLGKIDFKSLLGGISGYHTGVVLSIMQILFSVICLSWAGISYAKTKKHAELWDGEDEDEINQIEKHLNTPLFLCNTLMIGSICLYSCACYFLIGEINLTGWLIVADSILFMMSLGAIFVIEKKVIDTEKQLNPEKKGSLLDMNFSKTWLNSSDEAQKLMIYQAGYVAFQAGNMACWLLWILMFVMQLLLECGVLPVISVCAVWMVMNLTYMTTARKLESR